MGSAFVMPLVNLTKSHYEALMFLQAAKKRKRQTNMKAYQTSTSALAETSG